MLVLSRRTNKEVVITAPNGDKILIRQLGVTGDKVRLGFTAPPEYLINRREIQDQVDAKEAAGEVT